jgi:hypothetical protein
MKPFEAVPIGTKRFDQSHNRYEVKVAGHPLFPNRKWVNNARYVVAVDLDRTLLSCEVIHHKDGNSLNDAIENLELLSKEDHAARHSTYVRY